MYLGHYVMFLVLLTLTAWVYSPVFPEYLHVLLDGNNSHGLFVPLISGYFIWSKRRQLSAISPETAWGGLAVLITSLFLYYLGEAGKIEFLPRVSLILTIYGLVLLHFGSRFFRTILFPLGFLFFAVPIPVSVVDRVSFPLKMIATDISAVILRLFQIPVYQQGNLLYFANVSLEVAEACSGIRSMMTYFMLSTLMAFIMQTTGIRRLVIVFSAIPLAFLANLIRVVGTGVLAHFFGGQVARGFLHEFSGMVTFLFGLGLIYLVANLLHSDHGEAVRSQGGS